MGEARRRKALGLRSPKPNPAPDPPLQRHVLAMIDRRVTEDPETHELVFSEDRAPKNTYCSSDMRTLYQWDGVSLRRLDKQTRNVDSKAV